ncbi:MAG: HAMP domain-containing histidine kinase [Nocardioidaceae bacterium]|nr:HAMP domain-containing histidine kinase [Nocardioidaceae bacterium]
MSGRMTGTWLRSMRVRILAVVVGLLLLSSLGSVLLLRTVLFERLDDEIRVDLEQEAQEFRLLSAGNDPLTGEPFDGDLPAIFDVYFAREVPDEGESLLAFVDGELYASRRATGAGAADELQESITHWLSLTRTESGTQDTPMGEARYTAIPVRGRGDDGLFVVANFPALERSEIDAAVRTQMVVQLGTISIAALLGLALAGRVLRPLRQLAGTARRISDTDLSQRIPAPGSDEASQIAGAFNDMLARLETAFTSQRQFLDDASHELRTPLTIIRGHVEMLELDATPEGRQETVELVTDEVDRMGGIVNDLSLLARAEHPGFLTVETLDLRPVVRDIYLKATALAERRWRLETDVSVRAVADRHRISQALLQLAHNATKFTTEADTITIGVDLHGGRPRLWVDDSGVGVSPGDAETIFERFQRGTSGGGTFGGGLGLAIVRAIAEAHGGQARLVQRPGAGARFELTLQSMDHLRGRPPNPS